MPANVYECMFLLDPNKVANDVPSAAKVLHTLIERNQGEILASRPWDERRLAYPVKGHKKGQYYLTYFRTAGPNITNMEKDFQLNELILRYMVLNVDPKLVVHTAPESAPAEQYRGFLPIFLEAPDCRVILTTSAARGDGKSLTCMNLALTLASDLGRRVLVIDGDLRRPSAHRLLQIRPKLGLSDILRGDAELKDCAVSAKLPNLTLIPAGRPVRNPLVLLTSPAAVR